MFNFICKFCGKKFEYYRDNRVYCGRECKEKAQRKDNPKCFICSKSVKRRQGKYCSQFCCHEAKYLDYIKRWLHGEEDGMSGQDSISNHIRRYLFEKYDSKCCKCGWSEVNPVTEKVPLTSSHTDGNHKNNRPENLELLCPNCHSLTPTYGSLNMGNGRLANREYKRARSQMVRR